MTKVPPIIKGSTLWEGGKYKFQQLRDQNYDAVICLCASPFDAHCRVVPKEVILFQWRVAGGIQAQHGGSSGRDTGWFGANPDRVPEWLSDSGGSLSDAKRVLYDLVRAQPSPRTAQR